MPKSAFTNRYPNIGKRAPIPALSSFGTLAHLWQAEQYDGVLSDLDTIGGVGDEWVDDIAAASLSQATESIKPIYRAGFFDGRSAIQWDSGAAKQMNLSAAINTDKDITMIFLCSCNASGSSYLYFGGSGETIIFLPYLRYDAFPNDGPTFTASNDIRPVCIRQTRVDATNLSFDLYNGKAKTSHANITGIIRTLGAMGRSGTATAFDIAEIIFYDELLTEAKYFELIDTYAKVKYPSMVVAT